MTAKVMGTRALNPFVQAINENKEAWDKEIESANQKFQSALQKIDEDFPLATKFAQGLLDVRNAPMYVVLAQDSERTLRRRATEDYFFDQASKINKTFREKEKSLVQNYASSQRQLIGSQIEQFESFAKQFSQNPATYAAGGNPSFPMLSCGVAPTHALAFSHPITYITIKYDAGYGNTLSICGTGPKMSWDPKKALPLRCVGNDTWVYETNDQFEEFNYKILVNNQIWEEGPDHLIRRDKPDQITPAFHSHLS